jgi:hypothetical protein
MIQNPSRQKPGFLVQLSRLLATLVARTPVSATPRLTPQVLSPYGFLLKNAVVIERRRSALGINKWIHLVATLIGTKAIEKVGEKLGEGSLSLGGSLLGKLRHQAPNAVKRLESAADPTVIAAEIVDELRQVAAADPAVQKDIQMIQQQFGGVINQAQLAEKIGILIQGGYNPINIEKFEV